MRPVEREFAELAMQVLVFFVDDEALGLIVNPAPEVELAVLIEHNCLLDEFDCQFRARSHSENAISRSAV